jgi:hypothetical protein
MDAPTDPAKLRAALEHLEAVQAQRLAERIAAGELVEVKLFIVAGSESEARAQAEQAKAAKLAELRDAGDTREVVFDITLVTTGVCRHGEISDPAAAPSAPSFALREDVAVQPLAVRHAACRTEDAPPSGSRTLSATDEEAVQTDPEPVFETYIAVQTRRCVDDDDPGEIAEGYFSVDGSTVTVTNKVGGHVGSRTMLEGEDARVVAKQLLRGKSPEVDGFNRVLHYPNAGLQ